MAKQEPLKRRSDKTLYYTARRKRMQAIAAREAMKTRKMAGELVERRAVDHAWFKRSREVRDGLLNIPDRVSGIVAAETDQATVHGILMKEILQTLEALSDETTKTDRSPVAQHPRPQHPRRAQRAVRPS